MEESSREALIHARLLMVTSLKPQPDSTLDAIQVPWESPHEQLLYALGVHLIFRGQQGLFLDLQADLGRFHLTELLNDARLTHLRRGIPGRWRHYRSIQRIPSRELFHLFAPGVVADSLEHFVRRYTGILDFDARQRLHIYAASLRQSQPDSLDSSDSDTE